MTISNWMNLLGAMWIANITIILVVVWAIWPNLSFSKMVPLAFLGFLEFVLSVALLCLFIAWIVAKIPA